MPPPYLIAQHDQIPQELKGLARWVTWTYRERVGRTGHARWTKPPYTVDGKPASHSDPSTWSSYERVSSCDRIGFVLTKDDNLVALDLDDCIGPGGDVAAWAWALVLQLDSYTEASPSRNGLRILCRATTPEGFTGTKTDRWELYRSLRYVTLTGHVVWPKAISERSEPINELLRLAQSGGFAKIPPTGSPEHQTLRQGKSDGQKSAMGLARESVTAPKGGWEWNSSAPSLPESVKQLLGTSSKFKRRWEGSTEGLNDTSLSNVTFSLIASMARAYVPAWEIEQALGVWGRYEKVNRPNWLRGSISKAYAKLREKPERDGPALELLSPDQLLEVRELDWLVQGFLVHETLGVLYGYPGAYKSFLVLDWCLRTVCGLPWGSQDTAQGPALLIAGEGRFGLGLRLRAWLTHNALESRLTGGFHVLGSGIDLRQDTSAKRLLDALDAKPGLIVVDTLARCMVGGDENSGRDVGQVIANCDLLRRETGACVLIVHHSRKVSEKSFHRSGMDARGHSALWGAVDALFFMESKEGKRVVLTSEKEKDWDKPAPVELQWKPVERSGVLEVVSSGEADLQEVVSVLGSVGQTIKAIASSLKWHFRRAKRALVLAVSRGLASLEFGQVRGKSAEVFRRT